MKFFEEKSRYIFSLSFVIFLTIITTKYQSELHNLTSFGYLGIFTSCCISNMSVLLPAPSSIIVFTFSSIYSPMLVALLGALGSTLGESTGYLAGFSGRHLFFPSEDNYKKLDLLKNFSLFTIFLFAFAPLPIFDFVGVTSGGLKINFFSFLLACFLGKLLKMMVYAFAGYSLLPLMKPYFFFR